MKYEANGSVVVITGASSGFGKGVARKLAKSGANLVLAARRDNLLDELARECKLSGGLAVAVPTDVSRQDDMENLFRTAIKTYGRIDVWINNAGAAAVGLFNDVPLADHVQVLQTDLMGTVFGSYLAMGHFKEQGRGLLINVASMIGKIPAPYYSSYSAAKHGVVGLSSALRQELKAQQIENIQVCTVMPMAMDTSFFEHASNYTGRETVPIPPLDDAEKVIDAIIALLSHQKDEVPVGKTSASNVVFHNTAPPLSEAAMGALTHKAQMIDAPPAPPTEGGLLHPADEGTEVKDPKLDRKKAS